MGASLSTCLVIETGSEKVPLSSFPRRQILFMCVDKTDLPRSGGGLLSPVLPVLSDSIKNNSPG